MHTLHAVSPSPSWYLPAMQLVHSDMLAFGATLPAAHAVGFAAPSRHALPAGQAVQSACELSPVALPKEPSEHGVALGLRLPAAQ